MVMLAVLIALVIVMQAISAFAGKFGLFSITLTLVPLVVGAILLGPSGGAVLGFVFGLMVSIFSITGVDAGGMMVFQANALLAWLVCLLKGTMAGLLPGLLYKALPHKLPLLDAFLAAILAPIANTGIFIGGMLLFFRPLLETWKGFSDYSADTMLIYIALGLCGINFIIEFLVNAVLSPAIATIVRTAKKAH